MVGSDLSGFYFAVRIICRGRFARKNSTKPTWWFSSSRSSALTRTDQRSSWSRPQSPWGCRQSWGSGSSWCEYRATVPEISNVWIPIWYPFFFISKSYFSSPMFRNQMYTYQKVAFQSSKKGVKIKNETILTSSAWLFAFSFLSSRSYFAWNTKTKIRKKKSLPPPLAT